MLVGGQHYAPDTLPSGKRPDTHFTYKILGGLRGSFGLVGKMLPPRGFDPRTVQPIVTNSSQPISEKLCFSKHRYISTRPYDVNSHKSVNSLRITIKTQRITDWKGVRTKRSS